MNWQRSFDRCLWALLALVIGIYIALGIIVSAGRFYLPQLEKFTPTIIEQLEKQTALQWQIEGLSGEWQRFKPIFYLDRLQAHYADETDQEGEARSVFKLESGRLQLDLIASIINREPRVIEFEADRLALALDRNESAGWKLLGLQSRGGNRSLSLQGFFQTLQTMRANEILIDLPAGGSATLASDTPRLTARTVLPPMKMDYQRYGSAGRFVFEQQDEAGEGLFIQADTDGDVFTQDASFSVYARANNFALSPWFVSTQSDTSQQWLIENWSGQLWLNRDANERLRGTLQLTDGSVSKGDESQWRLSDVSILLGVKGNENAGIDLWWQELSGLWRDEPLAMPRANVSVSREGRKVSAMTLSAPLVDIGQLSEIIRGADILDESLVAIIDSLKPDGMVKPLLISVPNGQQMAAFSAQAVLDNVSFEPWKNIPGARGVSGYIEAKADGGILQLNSEPFFSVSFANIYQEALAFKSANALIDWKIDNNRLYVGGRDVALVDLVNDATYGLDFLINAKTRAEDEPSQMQLSIGVANSPASDLLRFLPYTVDKGLQDWAAQSGIRGHAIDGAFIYNGSMKKGDADRRSIALYFNLADTSLQFHPDWSRASAIDGLLSVTGRRTDMQVYDGEYAGLSIAGSQVSVITAGTDRYVGVDGIVQGSLSDALAVLQSPALAQQTGGFVGDWRGGGEVLDAKLKLKVPMVQDAADGTEIDFNGLIVDGVLDMQNIGLQIDNLNGPLAYSSQQGLVSQGLTGKLWGEPVDLVLGDFSADPDNRSGANFRVEGNTVVSADALYRWLRQPVIALADGATPISFRIDHIDAKTHVSANSSLEGLALPLPDIFYKTATEPANLQLDWRMSEIDQPLQLSISERASVALAFDEFALQRGRVDLGLNPSASLSASNDDEGLTVSGYLQRFNLSEWLPVFDRYLVAEQNLAVGFETDNSETSESATGVTVSELRIDKLFVFDEEFSNSVVDVNFEDQRWRFDVESDQLQGVIALPVGDVAAVDNTVDSETTASSDDLAQGESLNIMPIVNSDLDEGQRYLVDLQYLRIDQREMFGDENINLKHTLFSPSSLVAAKVDIQQLYWGDRPLGKWHFLISPTHNAVLVHDIAASYASLNLTSDDDDGLLWAARESGEYATALSLRATTDDIESFIKSLDSSDNPSSPIRGKRTEIDLDLNWPGGPDAFALNQVEGDVDFDVRDGQFLRASGSAQGLLKLVGAINLDTLVRRLQFNFSDLVQEGLSFDSATASFNINDGIVYFRDKPITVKAPSSAFTLAGQVDLEASTIDAELIATLPVASNLPWVAALAGGLPVAAGVFIASKVFENELDRLSSAVYEVKGPLNDPSASFNRLFDTKASPVQAADDSQQGQTPATN